MTGKVIWTKEVDDGVRKLIESEGIVTLNMFKEVAPEIGLTTLGKRIKDVAFEMGYNIDKLHSTNHDTPVIITEFDTEGDIEDTRVWTEEDSQNLLEVATNTASITMRELIEQFNMSSFTLGNELRRICKKNDIKIKGLGTRVPKGKNRLDCLIHFQFSDKVVKGITTKEDRKKQGIERFKVVIQSPDGTKQIVAMRAETPAQAMNKAESMFKGAKALKIKE